MTNDEEFEMSDDQWLEMVDDEGLLTKHLEVLDLELDNLLIVRNVVTDYDEMRISARSFDGRLPQSATDRFVDRLDVQEQIALMSPCIVEAVVEVLLDYVSADCRTDIVAALTSTANALFP
jgi:hypothetical protein